MTIVVAYSTTAPAALDAYREGRAQRTGFAKRLPADLRALGAGPDTYGRPGSPGQPDQITEVEQLGVTVPDGWEVHRPGRIRPRNTLAGRAAHQPPDPIHALAAHGLPREVWEPSGARHHVEVVEYDGTLWAGYGYEPGGPGEFFGVRCTWTPRTLGEWAQVRGRHAAAAAAAGAGAANDPR